MSVDAFVSATIDIGDVEKGIEAMERRGRTLHPAFSELKKPMRSDQKEHGKQQRGPFGTWARRASSTIEAYRERRKRVPRPLGKLLSAVQTRANAWSVSVESRVAWSDAHQEGATVGRGVRLKARPFLWLSKKFLDTAEDVFERVLLAAYGGGR